MKSFKSIVLSTVPASRDEIVLTLVFSMLIYNLSRKQLSPDLLQNQERTFDKILT